MLVLTYENPMCFPVYCLMALAEVLCNTHNKGEKTLIRNSQSQKTTNLTLYLNIKNTLTSEPGVLYHTLKTQKLPGEVNNTLQ